MLKIRLFERQDTEQIAQLFHDTVHQVNILDYSKQQVEAWAPQNIHFRNWAETCLNSFTYVAQYKGLIVGFAQLEPKGHIDCFYCHKNYQRCGVGSQLYQIIEIKAVELKLKGLFTEASITAKPFFERMGFLVIQEQQVTCRGETFINYAMKKLL